MRAQLVHVLSDPNYAAGLSDCSKSGSERKSDLFVHILCPDPDAVVFRIAAGGGESVFIRREGKHNGISEGFLREGEGELRPPFVFSRDGQIGAEDILPGVIHGARAFRGDLPVSEGAADQEA